MKFLSVFILLLLIFTSPILAQENVPLDLEVISSANVERLELLASWETSTVGYIAAAFSPDGRTLALALNDGTIQLLDTQTLVTERILEDSDIDGTEIHFNANGSLLLIAKGGTWRLWNVESRELIVSHETLVDESWSVFDNSLQVFAVQNIYGIVSFYDLITGEPRAQIIPAIDTSPRLKLNFGGALLLTSMDDTENVYVWDTVTGEQLYIFNQQLDGVLSGYGFSPDGSEIWASWQYWIYGRDDNQSVIQFWDAETGIEQFSLMGDGAAYRNVYYDDSREKIVVSGTGVDLADSIWIWDLGTQEIVYEFDFLTGGGSADFSPNEELLAMGSGTNANIYIWDYVTESMCFEFETESGRFNAPQFSPDGRLLLDVGLYAIRLWGVERDN